MLKACGKIAPRTYIGTSYSSISDFFLIVLSLSIPQSNSFIGLKDLGS